MKEKIIKILLGWVEHNEPIETTSDRLLYLFTDDYAKGYKKGWIDCCTMSKNLDSNIWMKETTLR